MSIQQRAESLAGLLKLDKGLHAFGLERRESIIRIEDRDRLGNGRILVRTKHVAVVEPAQREKQRA